MFTVNMKLILGVMALMSLVKAEIPSNLEDEGRKPSMFKVGEDWLALPEVFSNLDFTADSAPASEEDIEG